MRMKGAKKKAGKSPGMPSADCAKDEPQTTAKPERSADASRLAASRIQKSDIRGQSFKASPKRRFLKYLIMRAIQALPRLIFREIKAGDRLPAPPARNRPPAKAEPRPAPVGGRAPTASPSGSRSEPGLRPRTKPVVPGGGSPSQQPIHPSRGAGVDRPSPSAHAVFIRVHVPAEIIRLGLVP